LVEEPTKYGHILISALEEGEVSLSSGQYQAGSWDEPMDLPRAQGGYVIELADGDQGRNPNARDLGSDVPPGHGAGDITAVVEMVLPEARRFEDPAIRVTR